MLSKSFLATATGLLTLAGSSSALNPRLFRESTGSKATHLKRQYYPADATDVKTLTTPSNVTIRYKEPGKEGVCETTPGVNSYSGYIDLAPNVHAFFWFFESRRDPANDPITLWLNGGPGSDSLIGLFEELGPCRLTENLTSVVNEYSWTNVSNMLFLSQPVGVGFSYQEEQIGSLNEVTGGFVNASAAPPTGRYPILDPVNKGEIDTTELAAVATWHILQGFLGGLPQLDPEVGVGKGNKEKEFNLATESYGGHYGPGFFDLFYSQNQLIRNGTIDGVALNFNTLSIGNGIIDEAIQAEWYPEFATKNSYGIKAYNETVYQYSKFALNMPNGCLDQIKTCRYAAANGEYNYSTPISSYSDPSVFSICSEAQSMCRDNVEGTYYTFSGRGTYDIRHPSDDPTPPPYIEPYLNQAHVQNAIGVNLNYTTSNSDIYWQFQNTGDFIFPNFRQDLEYLLDQGLRINLFYGDADYICNVQGGEAVSLNINYTHSEQFAAAGYEKFMVDGEEFGEVRQYGNFSFLRIYEAGHEVPFYQPKASLAMFQRTLEHLNIADGSQKVTADLSTSGPANFTHTEPYVALPSSTSMSASASSSAAVFMHNFKA